MNRWGKIAAALVTVIFPPLAVLASDKHASKETTVQLLTLEPGHFHAALVQKFALPGVSPVVRVYAPGGEDLDQHLQRIEGFNARAEEPTQWVEQVYTGADFVDKALGTLDHPPKREHPTVLVLSGNNARKSEYIGRGIYAGMHVLADKPMIIKPAQLAALRKNFAAARARGVLVYDIMTERFEITTMLQRALSQQRALFGTIEKGTPEDPAITKISVHNFSKVVAGAQLKRPQWFFDPEQQGAGIVDVTTHLVDLVQWEAFPGVALSPSDAIVLNARRWTTPLTLEQFGRVTGAQDFPGFLQLYVRDEVLHAPSNGEFTYTLKGVHARVSVTWEFEAPPGAGDTHFSVMRGTRATLTIRQGAEQGYKPVLYIERDPSVTPAQHQRALMMAMQDIAKTWPGVDVKRDGDRYVVVVPDKYHNGHEAHFAQVTQNFLGYVRAGRLPDWEVPNMITKYATIMQAYEKSQ